MAIAVIGALRVNLGMDSASFERGARRSESRLQSMQRRFRAAGRSMQRAGARLSIGLTAPLVAFGQQAVRAAGVQEQAVAQVTAALASMGDVAGYNLQQLQDMASAMQDRSLYGDEEILQKVTANLLTFGNISGEVFERTQQAALDMSQRLGQDLQSSAVMLGKALNDPILGLTALGRVGVQFSDDQRAMIRAMVEAGDVAGAQALILNELERQYSGAAEAAASTDSGRITQAWNSIGDAMEKIGAIILPIVADIADKVKEWAEAFQALSPETQTMIVKALALAAALGPALAMVGLMVSAMAPLAGVFAALASPIGLVVIGITALGFAIWKNWDYISSEFPAVANAIEVVIAALKQSFQQMLDRLIEIFTRVISWVENTINVIDSLLQGEWRAAWDFALAAIGDVFGLIDALLMGWPSKFYNYAMDMITDFVSGLTGSGGTLREGLAAILATIMETVTSWSDSFYQWGADLVDSFIDGMTSRLDAVTSFWQRLGSTSGADTPQAGWSGGGDTPVDPLDMQIYGSGGDAAAQGAAMGDDFSRGVRGALEIRSPSRVMQEIGRFAMQGLGLGIADGQPVATEAMRAAAADLENTVRDAGLKDAIDGWEESVAGLGRTSDQVFERFGGWLGDLIKGTTTLRETLASAFASSGRNSIQTGLGALGGVFKDTMGDSAGGIVSGLLGSLMGFQYGGQFEVPGGGGIDSELVAFRATPGETVRVTRPDQEGGFGGGIMGRIVIEEAPGFASRVQGISGGVAVETVRSYDRGMPSRLQQISNDPRVR